MKSNRYTPEQIIRKLREAEGRARHRSFRTRGRESAGHKRGYLPLLEKALRWHADRCHEAIAGAGEGERPPQEDRSRASRGHEHPKEGEPGKLLSPTRRRAAVVRVCRRLEVSERRVCKVIGQPALPSATPAEGPREIE